MQDPESKPAAAPDAAPGAGAEYNGEVVASISYVKGRRDAACPSSRFIPM